jgi:SAM-dependent methyltransferase
MSMPETSQRVDWDEYAKGRLLGRNRLTLEHHREVIDDFLAFFSHRPNDLAILDVGCSAGFFLVLLRELGFQNLEGCDISEHFVAQARQKGLNCRVDNVFAMRDERPPTENHDVIMLMDILEHLDDPVAALKTVRENLLAKGGLVYATVPIYDSLHDKYERIAFGKTKIKQSKEHDPTHVQAFSENSFRAALGSAGFRVFESRRLYCEIPRIRSVRLRSIVRQVLPASFKGKFLRVAAESIESPSTATS